MKITPDTIRREVAALRRYGKQPPFYLLIGPKTSWEEAAEAITETGEAVVIIQDAETPNLFMMVDKAGFDYMATPVSPFGRDAPILGLKEEDKKLFVRSEAPSDNKYPGASDFIAKAREAKHDNWMIASDQDSYDTITSMSPDLAKNTPETDGINHINVYSKGKTEVGRFLSNFTKAPIVTEDGPFDSIEGYWYWLSTKDDALRTLSGNEAKTYGRKVRGKDWVENQEFRDKICRAITKKLESNPEWFAKFRETKLPLDHYYVMRGKITRPKQGVWILDHLDNLRKQLNLF